MTTRWITPFLGTAPAALAETAPNIALIDVRDLADKMGNDIAYVQEKITAGAEAIKAGQRVIVCCDYGISRSNAVAAGILARLRGSSVNAAVREVIVATGEAEIKLEMLDVVRSAIDAPWDPVHAKPGHPARVLVTGGSGFIGKAVANKLTTLGITVVAPPRSDLDLITGRIELDMLVRDTPIDQVIHLANPRVYTSNVALGQTLSMLRNVLEVCALNRLPLIYLSCWEIYSGYATAALVADEALPPLATGPYGETKYLCEVLIDRFRVRDGLRCAVIRPSSVYGPGSGRPKFIRTFIEKASRGERISTHCYANGTPALDFLHIDDVSDAIARVISTGFTGNLNIGTGRLTTTRQIAEWIIAWSKSASELTTVTLTGNTACIAMNHSKATQRVGWKPEKSIETGLRELVDIARTDDLEG